jgi:hypothetical protein
MDCHYPDFATRSALHEFSLILFDPGVIGRRKFEVILEDEKEALVFVSKKLGMNSSEGHARS